MLLRFYICEDTAETYLISDIAACSIVVFSCKIGHIKLIQRKKTGLCCCVCFSLWSAGKESGEDQIGSKATQISDHISENKFKN